jgi:hypothetical protein
MLAYADVCFLATGYVIPVGNMQQRVVVDVLLHQDVVEGEDTATPSLRGARSLRRRLLECNKWNVVQVRCVSIFYFFGISVPVRYGKHFRTNKASKWECCAVAAELMASGEGQQPRKEEVLAIA